MGMIQKTHKVFLTMRYMLCFLSLLAVVNVHAADNDPVATRQAIFKKMLRTAYEPMGLMVRERDPYKADKFRTYATALQTLAREPWTHFPAGSTQGKVKAEIWQNPVAFKKAQDDFVAKVDTLANSSKNAQQLADVKPSYQAVAQSCKSCHNDFRRWFW